MGFTHGGGMNPHRAFSLRSTLTSVVGVIAVFAILVSAAIVFLTSALHRVTAEGTKAFESVRVALQAEIVLLLHARTSDSVVKHGLEVSLARLLNEARQFATSDVERQALSDVASAVNVYFGASSNPRLSASDLPQAQDLAYDRLESFVTLNVNIARSAQRRAEGWDRAGNWIGIGVAGVVLLVAALTLAWLKRRAFAPILSLSSVMKRFGSGERQLRAAEEGASEWREMSRRFNEMGAAIAAQQQAQIAFLASVAHDIRTPLSVLKTAGSILDSGRPLPPEPALREMSQRIARQVAKLERMANDFLDLSSLESRGFQLTRDIHDVRAIVTDVVLGFGLVFPERRIQVSLPAEPALAYCDQLRIGQVVTNLISNALKYSPTDSPVEIALASERHEVTMLVRDYGLGISESDRERVFEPFRRTDLSKESIPGVGLGLFIVRCIVEKHDGRIDVQSNPGAGSTFRVALPRAPSSGH
jgi:two-component system sensor histidine kinase MtrB